MKLISTSMEEIKKSKFIGYLYELDSVDEVKVILDDISSKNKRARHIPYAYIYKSQARKTDDKEPNGTAGNPIYNVLIRENLDHHLICVVRFFGGVKLGAGPLLRAYSKAANDLIEK